MELKVPSIMQQCNYGGNYTAQKIKFSIKEFFSKCDQICSFLWADLLTFSEEIYLLKERNRFLHLLKEKFTCKSQLAFSFSHWETLTGVTTKPSCLHRNLRFTFVNAC